MISLYPTFFKMVCISYHILYIHACTCMYHIIHKICDIISYIYTYAYIYIYIYTHTYFCFLSVSLFLRVLFFFLLNLYILFIFVGLERTVNELLTLVFRKNQSLPRAIGTYNIYFVRIIYNI